MTDVALDTETGLIAPGVLAPPLVCVSYASRIGEIRVALEHHTECRETIDALLLGDDIIWGLHIAYDMGVIATAFPDLLPSIFDKYDRGEILDVGINAMLLDLAAGCFEGFRNQEGEVVKLSYHLADLAKRFGGMELDKGEDAQRLRYIELRDVPLERWPAEARQYALDDAEATLKVAEAVGRTPDDAAQARAAFALHLLSLHGIRTDGAKIDALELRTQAELKEIEEVLVASGLVRKNGSRDTKKAKERMIEVMGGEHLCKPTKGGGVSLDKDACAESGDKLLGYYAQRMGLVDKINVKCPKLREGAGDHPIQGRFYVLSETGRVRCSEGKIGNGYQLTNVEKEGGIRECFVPRPGFVFCDIDFPGLELRTMAQAHLLILGRSTLAEQLNAGIDPHLDMAAQLLGISYEEAKARRKAGDHVVEDARTCGKAGNFGFPGMMGAERFINWARAQYKIVLTEARAREIKNAWFMTKPEFRDYFAFINTLCGSANIGTGEALYTGRKRALAPAPELANFFFQALGSDIAKTALYEVQRACWADVESPLYGCRPVNFVHDEILAEIRFPEQGDAMGEIMREVANRFLPDVPMPEMEPALSRYWSKDAKMTRDEDGRLTVWEG